MHVYTCIHIYIYIHIDVCLGLKGSTARREARLSRPRENIVGVKMVLAESVKLKHGL